MGAPHAEHALVPPGQIPQRVEQGVQIRQDERPGLPQQQGIGRVNDVGRGAAQMDEPRLGTHLFLKGGEKGDDIVARDFLDGEDALHVDVRLPADDGHGFSRDAAKLRPGVADGKLHGQPCPVAVFQSPDTAHFRPGIAFYHAFLVGGSGR